MPKQASPGLLKEEAGDAFREAVGRVFGGAPFDRPDDTAGDPPPEHGIAHGHPARLLVKPLTGSPVEDSLSIEVKRSGPRRRHPHPQLGEQVACGHNELVRVRRHTKF